MFPLADLTDDLTPDQLHALLHWLWARSLAVTRANIKGWRRANNLS